MLIAKYLKFIAAIHEKKISLTLNKPIYVGFTVLETSKWEMHNFHYNFMIRKFNTRLLFTDTDSLCYECDEDPREKMYKYKELFDLSNFSVSSKYYCSDNKKVLGKMKDEYGGKWWSFKNFMIHCLRKRFLDTQ